MLLSYIALIFGVIGAIALLPQTHKIFTRKSAHDISANTYIFTLLSAIIWSIYGIQLKSTPMIITNSIVAINSSIIIIGCIKYGTLRFKTTKT